MDNRIHPKAASDGTTELQSVELPKKPTVLQAGAEGVDLVENASAAKPLSPTLAKILGENPVLEATLDPDALLQAGIPIEENVELPTTLPNGNAVDPGLSAFNIGDRGRLEGPNHFGIDLSKGRVNAQDVITAVLGIANSSPVAPTGGIPAPPNVSMFASGEPGLVDGIISWIKSLFTADGAVNTATDVALEKFGPPGAGEAMQLLNAPKVVGDVTGDPVNLLRGVTAYGTGDSGDALLKKVDDGSKYVNPDADPSAQIYLTPEQALRIVKLIENINVKPANPDSGENTPTVTADDLKGAGPLEHRFVIDRNPDAEDLSAMKSPGEIINPEGPDTVNPNDEVAPLPPPTDIPDTPRGGGTIS